MMKKRAALPPFFSVPFLVGRGAVQSTAPLSIAFLGLVKYRFL